MLRGSYDLPALRISSRPGSASRPSLAVFEALRGRGDATEVATCELTMLGVPEKLTDLPSSSGSKRAGPVLRDDDFRLPTDVLDKIRAAANDVGFADIPPHSALWLEVASPRGLLYLVPWERLLAPIARPVLRLPNFLLRPQSSASALTAVVCVPDAGDPEDGARQVARLSTAWLRHSGTSTRLHVFGNPALFRALRSSSALPDQVRLHDPYRSTPRSGDSVSGDPWLNWVRDELTGSAVDVVQIVTPGSLVGGRGGVPMLQGATAEDRWRRIVGAIELAGFLGEVGAWGLVLTAAGSSASVPGLRELADTVSRLVPGVVVLWDPGFGDRLQLERAIQLAVGRTAELTTALPALTCWVHPEFVELPWDQQQQLMVGDGGQSVLLGESTRTALAQEDTPGWLASTSRFLETQQSKWLRDPGLVGPDVPAASTQIDPDVAAALGSVAGLLDRHAAAYLSDGDKR